MAQRFALSAGDVRLARGQVDLVHLHAALALESIAQQLDHRRARKVVVAQAQQPGHAAPDALRDQRRRLLRGGGEPVLGGEAVQQVDVVRVERARHDGDVARRNAVGEQLRDLRAHAARLLDAVLELRDLRNQCRTGFSLSGRGGRAEARPT